MSQETIPDLILAIVLLVLWNGYLIYKMQKK